MANPCPTQLLTDITIVASEKTILGVSSDVSFNVDKPELLSVTKDGRNFTLDPVGPLGLVKLKIGSNNYNINIVAGSPASIKINTGV